MPQVLRGHKQLDTTALYTTQVAAKIMRQLIVADAKDIVRTTPSMVVAQ